MHRANGAVVIVLYGSYSESLGSRVDDYTDIGLNIILVNNNKATSSVPISEKSVGRIHWVENNNRGGLAGGFNRGVSEAARIGHNIITILDQDSELSPEGITFLQEQARMHNNLIIGPRIWDQRRKYWHTKKENPRMLISSGTTFQHSVWKKNGPFHEWMEIDYIDHEWCFRAAAKGLSIRVAPSASLNQYFGEPYPNSLVHRLGLQMYSPYRRAIAMRNLRWLAYQSHVPLDIRIKEIIKMLIKPVFWLALEAQRRQTLQTIQLGLTAPLYQPFPKHLLTTNS